MKIFEIISEESESSDKPVVFPSGNKITTGVFAKNLAQYFHGLNAWTNRSFHRTKWTMSRGGAYYDPEWNVQFDNLDDRDDAWQDIKQRAQLVHTKDPYNRESVKTYAKVGKFLLAPYSNRHGPSISVSTTSILRNMIAPQVDITDQQAAAIHDIISSKTKNAIERIKDIITWANSEQEVKKILDNSNKLTPKDKSIIDDIIAGAKNFREPN